MIGRREFLAGAAALSVAPAHAQAKNELVVSRQPGILYMALHVIEKNRLFEKHAEKQGISAPAVKWVSFANGGAQQDALIAGGVDIVNTGTGNMLLLWDRTRGGVKGICASTAARLTLVSRDPRIKTLADYGTGDKIAVPTVKVSTQAILLQMAAVKMFGHDKFDHFDPLTVQMGHPDAFVAMKNAIHEVRNHFAAPPFDFYEIRQIEGAHVVTDSFEIIGGPLTQGQFFTTTKFADANPKWIAAVHAAAEEARLFILAEPEKAVEAYKELNNDKTETAVLVELVKTPAMANWALYPQGTMKFANHLKSIGSLKTAPASWKDYYLPVVHDLPGS
ncbi:MAG: ABC transporter substrate-binding protein [Beijerinckiaceae bacterium]